MLCDSESGHGTTPSTFRGHEERMVAFGWVNQGQSRTDQVVVDTCEENNQRWLFYCTTRRAGRGFRRQRAFEFRAQGRTAGR